MNQCSECSSHVIEVNSMIVSLGVDTHDVLFGVMPSCTQESHTLPEEYNPSTLKEE